MANITQELATIQTAVYGKDMRQAIYDALRKLSLESNANAMSFVSETVSIGTAKECKLTVNDIAQSSPVYVMVKARTTAEDTVVRSDGEELTDIVTGNVVDNTMTSFQVTAEDILAGMKATGSMSIQVKYYSANCEDLLQRMSGNSGYTETSFQQQLAVSSTPAITQTSYTVEGSE